MQGGDVHTQNSCRLLTFKEQTSQESMLSEQRFSNPFINDKIMQNKRVYDVHQGEPYFKLTKFYDFAQLVQYEINKRRAANRQARVQEEGQGQYLSSDEAQRA